MKILTMTILFVIAFGTGGMLAEVTHQPVEKIVTRTQTTMDYESLDACMSSYYKGVETIDMQIDIINTMIDIIWGDQIRLDAVRVTPKPSHMTKIDGTKPSPVVLKI